jgi:hypothetical protein
VVYKIYSIDTYWSTQSLAWKRKGERDIQMSKACVILEGKSVECNFPFLQWFEAHLLRFGLDVTCVLTFPLKLNICSSIILIVPKVLKQVALDQVLTNTFKIKKMQFKHRRRGHSGLPILVWQKWTITKYQSAWPLDSFLYSCATYVYVLHLT